MANERNQVAIAKQHLNILLNAIENTRRLEKEHSKLGG